MINNNINLLYFLKHNILRLEKRKKTNSDIYKPKLLTHSHNPWSKIPVCILTWTKRRSHVHSMYTALLWAHSRGILSLFTVTKKDILLAKHAVDTVLPRETDFIWLKGFYNKIWIKFKKCTNLKTEGKHEKKHSLQNL